MPEEAVTHPIELIQIVALLGAAVVAVPIFKRLGLGTVLGYLAAGVVIGPFGLRLFQSAEAVLQVAEFGVVMLLFVIGLELQPSRLWNLRKDIFGLGLAQVLICGALLVGAGVLFGYLPKIALVAAMGLSLSSTALDLQILEERGETTASYGRKSFSILLLQDLAIVPILAVLALLAPASGDTGGAAGWVKALTAIAAVAGVVFAARYLLNPLFRLLAGARAREIMTAAALLIVLGAAFAMQAVGLSMGLGAFLAGVALSESSFRHQLEADIEPFRGLLLGLFFLAIGMTIDWPLVGHQWLTVAVVLVLFMALKIAGIYTAGRVFRAGHRDALKMALLLAQGGEFAFVLYTAAADTGVISADVSGILTAVVILSMALTPLLVLMMNRLLPKEEKSLDGVTPVEAAEGIGSTALIIGFGRFGQVASQFLLARGIDVTIIDSDPDMIRNAARFGFKIYYGDGQRLDVLRASGAMNAKIICICINDRDATNVIVDVMQEDSPLTKLYVRSFDRGHSLTLYGKAVEYEIRETVELAIALGEASLLGLGFTDDEAAETARDVRRRDRERLRLQQAEGIRAGGHLVYRAPEPTPLTPVRSESQPLSPETAAMASDQRPKEPADADR